MFVTDLNARERERYAGNFDTLVSQATDCAEALRAGDDTRVLAGALVFALVWAGFSGELLEVLKAGTNIEIPTDPSKAEREDG